MESDDGKYLEALVAIELIRKRKRKREYATAYRERKANKRQRRLRLSRDEKALRLKEYRARPDVCEKLREYQRAYYLRKKAERLARELQDATTTTEGDDNGKPTNARG